MTTQIMPELEKHLRTLINKVKEPLVSVNKMYYEKLINEEQKSDHMVSVFQSKLEILSH